MISGDEHDQESAYQAALDFLYSFINLERTTLERYHASKMDPVRPGMLLEALGNPQSRYAAVHIAGTKGKGSVAAMCAAALRAAGLRVGLYTSPHLRDFRERIRVQTPEDEAGLITRTQFVEGLANVRTYLPEFPEITWFEIVTALAFDHFARQQVDIAVVEVGLGGRLDATNIIQPLVSVITSLSMDHANLLGDTIAEIAMEKGGIIKPGVPLMIAPQPPEAMAVLQAIATERGSPVQIVGRDWQYQGRNHWLTVTETPKPAYVPAGTGFVVALAGLHQLENGMLSVAALEPVQREFGSVTLESIQRGLAGVQWDGRLQMVLDRPGWPRLLVDAAHNYDSATKLSAALQSDYVYERLWMVFGAPQDKAIPEMMAELFPLADGIILAAANHPRAAAPQELAAQAAELGFEVQTAASPAAALATAFARAGSEDLICATGSIIFLGDLLNSWDRLQSQLLLPRG